MFNRMVRRKFASILGLKDEADPAEILGRDAVTALEDYKKLVAEGKAQPDQELELFTSVKFFKTLLGVSYPEVRKNLVELMAGGKTPRQASNEILTHAIGYGYAKMGKATKTLKMSFDEFKNVMDATGLGPRNIDTLIKAGVDRQSYILAADSAVKQGVPIEFITDAAKSGMKFTNPAEIAHLHKWSAQFPLEFIAGKRPQILALKEASLADAKELQATVPKPELRLELLSAGAKPGDVKALAGHFSQEHLPEMLRMAAAHGVPVQHLVTLKQEGVNEGDFNGVLAAHKELAAPQQQALLHTIVDYYKKGLRDPAEFRMAHELRESVRPGELAKAAQLGVKEGLSAETLAKLHGASVAIGESLRNVHSALVSMQRDRLPAEHARIKDRLMKWNPHATQELGRSVAHRRRE